MQAPESIPHQDKLGEELFDKVQSGEASEEEKEQFEDLATEFGVPVKGINNIVYRWHQARSARSKGANVQGNARDRDRRREMKLLENLDSQMIN